MKTDTATTALRTDFSLTLDKRSRFEMAKDKGFVCSDAGDEFDAVAEAYRLWCAEMKEPHVHIAAGRHTSRVTLSLFEMKAELMPEAEMLYGRDCRRSA